MEYTIKSKWLLQLFFLCLSMYPAMPTQAQTNSSNNEDGILLMGKNDGKQITLRWRIDNYADFNLAKENGFIIEQKIIDKGASFSSQNFEKIQTTQVANRETFFAAIQNDKRNKSLIASASILHPDSTPSVHEKDITGHIDLVYKQNQQHGILMMQADLDITSSMLLGLRADIGKVEASKDYYFRIVSNTANGKQLLSNIIQIEGDKVHTLPALEIHALSESDSLISLQWKKEIYEGFYMAYLIERANDSGSFRNILSLPFFYVEDPLLDLDNDYIHFHDHVENNQPYKYQIKGISPFGEISEYSNIVEAQAEDKTAPTLPDTLWLSLKENNEILIQWEYRNQQKSKDLEIVEIERSLQADQNFELVSSSNSNSAVDKIDDSNPYYFYRLKLIDSNKNYIYSNPTGISIPDSIPPTIPILVSAELDTTGLVTLIWEENPEKDLLGYQVHIANHKDGIYTNLVNKAYKDTRWTTHLDLNNLNKDVYFKIQSLDKHFNHSALSAPIKLKRPDKHPPLPAYFKDYFVKENAIEMTWERSNSIDLEKQLLMRRILGENEWLQLEELGKEAMNFVDTTALEGVIYEYTISSIDDSGNSSMATDVLRLKGMGKLYLDEIENFNLRFDKENKALDLTWNESTENIRAYIIYRSVNDGPFRTFKTVKPNKLSITDKNIKEERTYEYYIVAVGKNGKKTKKSTILNYTL